MADLSKITLPNNTTVNLKDANVPHSSLTAASSGTDLSLVTTGEKYTWNNKQNALTRPVTGAAVWDTADRIVVTNANSGNVVKQSAYTIATSVPSGAVFTDTKNTAGSTDTSSKIFLIGATEQSANPQTYSDDQVYVTNGTLTAGNAQATILGVVPTNGTSGGISLYGGTGSVDTYGIAFRTTANKEKHGYVQSDWATYFTMNDADNRGWIFRRNKSGGNVASINTSGNAVFNGSVTIGGNTTNPSGARMQYNSTTQAIDFVFT